MVFTGKYVRLYINVCVVQYLLIKKIVSFFLSVSHPAQVVLPFPRWEPKEKPVREDDVGPQVQHIYEVRIEQTQNKTFMVKIECFKQE